MALRTSVSDTNRVGKQSGSGRGFRSGSAAGCLEESLENVSLEFSADFSYEQMIRNAALILPSSILDGIAAASSSEALLRLELPEPPQVELLLSLLLEAG